MGKYFSIKELCKSDTAERLRIDNTPDADSIANMNKLIEKVLDPLREWYNKPIYVNSGYRSEALNKAVKGAKNSQHKFGTASDISVRSIEENKKLFDYIKDNLEYDQLIWEKGGVWIHVSYVTDRPNRKQVLYL